MDVNVNESTAVSGESAASEQTAGNYEATDSIEDSSWRVSTNMVPIIPSETQISPADDTIDEIVPKEEPANMDACLAVRSVATLIHTPASVTPGGDLCLSMALHFSGICQVKLHGDPPPRHTKGFGHVLCR